MEALMINTINTHLLPATDQHGFRPRRSTSTALLQLTSDVATSFNKRKSTHQSICVAWICHQMLCGWYNCVGNRIQIPEPEHKVNTYFTEMSRFLQVNSLLTSAPKSSVTLFTPDPAQANTHPTIKIDDSELHLVRSPKLLGVYLYIFFSFNTHCVHVTNRVSKRNNILKVLAGTTWEQQKNTLLLLFAFRDLWKEWGDSNFQIFSQNCQFHHRRLESLENFNVLFIYHFEHYGPIFGPYGCHIIFTRSPLFHSPPLPQQVHFACVLCI